MSVTTKKQQLEESPCNLKEERVANLKYILQYVCLFAFCLVIFAPALGIVFSWIKD